MEGSQIPTCSCAPAALSEAACRSGECELAQGAGECLLVSASCLPCVEGEKEIGSESERKRQRERKINMTKTLRERGRESFICFGGSVVGIEPATLKEHLAVRILQSQNVGLDTSRSRMVPRVPRDSTILSGSLRVFTRRNCLKSL